MPLVRVMFCICRAAFVAFVRCFALFAFSGLEIYAAYQASLAPCKYGLNKNCNLVSLDPVKFGTFYTCAFGLSGCGSELLAPLNIYSTDANVMVGDGKCQDGFDFRGDLDLMQGAFCNSKIVSGVCVESVSSTGFAKWFDKLVSRWLGDWRSGFLGDMVNEGKIFPSNYYASSAQDSSRCVTGHNLVSALLGPDAKGECFGDEISHHKMCVGKTPKDYPKEFVKLSDMYDCVIEKSPKRCYHVKFYNLFTELFSEIFQVHNTPLHTLNEVVAPVVDAFYSTTKYTSKALVKAYNWIRKISDCYPDWECAFFRFSDCQNENKGPKS